MNKLPPPLLLNPGSKKGRASVGTKSKHHSPAKPNPGFIGDHYKQIFQLLNGISKH